MKCTLCNERNGNTRCEGCNTLFCLPCMNKHHDELVQQFQLLMDMRNEVKQSIEVPESTSINGIERPCLNEINEWERESIQRIQQIAAKARVNVDEIVTKHMNRISHRFEQLSVDMQEQQKEGIYLEYDLENVRTQLEQLKNDIKQMNDKIRIDSTISKSIEWDTIMYIVEDDIPSKTTSESIKTEDTVKKENINDSSSVPRQTEQSITKPSGSNSISVQVVKSNSSSKSSNRKNPPPGICALCERSFINPSFIGICVDCRQQQYYRLHA